MTSSQPMIPSMCCRAWNGAQSDEHGNPPHTPDHTGVTSQEIAGKLIGAKTCEVKLGVYEPGGRSIVHTHPHSEHVLYILEGQLTVIDGAKNEATAFAEQALYVPAGEVHMAENRGAGRTRYIAVTAPPPE